jgi:hypothetical protein
MHASPLVTGLRPVQTCWDLAQRGSNTVFVGDVDGSGCGGHPDWDVPAANLDDEGEMLFFSNIFSELLVRAREGDRTAQVQFREELERAMVHLVKQTLKSGGDSLMARRIRAKARRVHLQSHSAQGADPDAFVRAVARGVCDDVVGQVQPRQLAMAETVCESVTSDREQ